MAEAVNCGRHREVEGSRGGAKKANVNGGGPGAAEDNGEDPSTAEVIGKGIETPRRRGGGAGREEVDWGGDMTLLPRIGDDPVRGT